MDMQEYAAAHERAQGREFDGTMTYGVSNVDVPLRFRQDVTILCRGAFSIESDAIGGFTVALTECIAEVPIEGRPGEVDRHRLDDWLVNGIPLEVLELAEEPT